MDDFKILIFVCTKNPFTVNNWNVILSMLFFHFLKTGMIKRRQVFGSRHFTETSDSVSGSTESYMIMWLEVEVATLNEALILDKSHIE